MEMNSLLGCFVESHVAALSDSQVRHLSKLLETHRDVDLYPWLAGKVPIPSDMLTDEIMLLLRYVNPKHPSLKHIGG